MAVLDGCMLNLSEIGRIRLRLHRPLQGTPKTVTISREADGWYVCISCAQVPTEPLPLTGKETGIDVGLTVFLVRADGEPVPTQSPLLPPCRAAAQEGPALGHLPQEGHQASPQGGPGAR